ncbi:MAG: type II secretion system F family protein [Candidatus Altiarchaeota archaeon]|nr:type II secretion system F family protein [Candidatus Altiarchaeota archaeon]
MEGNKTETTILKRVFITASKVFPRKYKEVVGQYIIYAGMDVETDVWLGMSLLLGIFVFFTVMFLSNFGYSLLFYVLAFVAFILYLVGSYLLPYFIAMNRSDVVEKILPSALQLMASNIRAGMTPFQSMKFAARDEFGILKEELDRATTKALGTASFPDALSEMTKRINLPSLKRSIRLLTGCIESGGQLANVLEESSRDIMEIEALKKELSTSTRTYNLLIMFVVIFCAPILLTISIYFVERLTTLKSSFDVSDVEGVGMGILVVTMGLTPQFLVNMATLVITITAFLSGILIGVIKKGDRSYGFKYSVVLVPITLIVFYIMRYLVKFIAG